jgi:hypothetical protein
MASKRHRRQKACTGKDRYETYEAAAEKARQDCRTYHTRVCPYRCQFSGKKPHYHVGHPPREVRQAIDARRRGE